jgi:hypothetical protein
MGELRAIEGSSGGAMTQRERFDAWRSTQCYATPFEIELQFMAWQASKYAALDQAWEAVHAERLIDPTEEHGDLVYQRAVEDCENAVFALKEKS